MKLHFLGQTYFASERVVETVPSDLTLCFRGQSYILRRPLENFKSNLEMRIYRGISYYKS